MSLQGIDAAMSMKVASRPSHRRATTGAQCGRRNVIAILLVGLAVLLGIGPAFADEFYFSRTRTPNDAERGGTGLFLWNDTAGTQSQIGGDGTYMRHVTDGPIPVDGLATDLSGNLFGFAIDDASTAGFIPWDPGTSCSANHRSRLVSIDTGTAEIAYVGASWLSGRHLSGAAFDGQGRLWALDCIAAEVIEINPATGSIVGTPIAIGAAPSIAMDIDFAANGLGIIGYGGLEFYVVNTSTGTVANVPISAVNNGFDGVLTPPYAIVGTAFTNHLSARNGSLQADSCRLNLVENRGLDELGHANDPFFANPVIAHKEFDQYDPPNRATGFYNGGPGDIARVGGPALANCFYDWGDAPGSYATLLAADGARHAIVAGSPYLGADLPDFEVDGQPNVGATGDDSAGTDDEDGVTVPALPVGATVQIEVMAGNVAPGTLLQGWIDWAGDGSFAQAGDQVLVDTAVATGTNTFDIAVPATATVGTTYARFRIANQAGLGFDGLADSGEVEDYQVQVAAGQADLAITKDDGSDTYRPGLDVAYTIVVSNNGPSAVIGAQVSDPLPPGISTGSWTCGDTTGGGVCGAASGTGAIDTTADLPVGASVTYILSLAIPSTYTSDLVNTATVAPPDGMTDANLDNNQATDTDTMEEPPVSGACAPRLVTPALSFTMAPFPATGTTDRSPATGWNPGNPWSKNGGDYVIRWNFSQPIPGEWFRFAIGDVADVSVGATFTITLGGGSTATVGQLEVVSGHFTHNGSGVLRRGPATGTQVNGLFGFNTTGTITSLTITTSGVPSADYIVNRLLVRPPCMTVSKVSEGGTGSFTIDMTNVVEADGTAVPSVTLTTTTPDTPVSTPENYSPSPGSAMTLSEVVPAGWNLESATCTDENAGNTGNPTVIGSFVSPTLTVPAENVRPEADIRCLFTNAAQPAADLSIVKTVAPQDVAPGDEVVYTIEVTNNGPEAADEAIVTDPGVQDSLECTALACSAAGGAACPAASTPAQLAAGLVIPTFPNGGTVTLELTCTVTATGTP